MNDTFNGQKNFDTAGTRTGSAAAPPGAVAAATRTGNVAACTIRTGTVANVPVAGGRTGSARPATCMNGYSIIRKVAQPAKCEEEVRILYWKLFSKNSYEME